MKKYDDIEYYLEHIPDKSNPIQACIYGGFFLGFLIHGKVNTDLVPEEMVTQFKQREKTGPQIYLALDGKLTEDMMVPDLAKFADWYLLGENPRYQKDFGAAFLAKYVSPFEVSDTWENFAEINQRITRTFTNWMMGKG